LELCGELGVPMASSKTVGPTRSITFLGVEIDTAIMVVRLPAEKVDRLKETISKWQAKRVCTERELLSLIGQLQHACCVVRVGRTFLRRMIELSTVPKELRHRVRLNEAIQSDLAWWHLFWRSGMAEA